MLAATSLLLLATIRTATAQTDTTWIGGNGAWKTGSNWTGGVAPNSAQFNAFVDGDNEVDSEVQISGSNSVGRLTVDGRDSLVIQNVSHLGVYSGPAIPNSGRIQNDGLIIPEADSSSIRILNDVTLSGGGTIQLNGGLSDRQIAVRSVPHGQVANGRLINDGSTIQGSGGIGAHSGRLDVVNQVGGVINGYVPSPSDSFENALAIYSDETLINRGTLRASNGGSLALLSHNGADNSGGIIEGIDGGIVAVLNNIEGERCVRAIVGNSNCLLI